MIWQSAYDFVEPCQAGDQAGRLLLWRDTLRNFGYSLSSHHLPLRVVPADRGHARRRLADRQAVRLTWDNIADGLPQYPRSRAEGASDQV